MILNGIKAMTLGLLVIGLFSFNNESSNFTQSDSAKELNTKHYNCTQQDSALADTSESLKPALIRVTDMPYFPQCYDTSNSKRQRCTNSAINKYISEFFQVAKKHQKKKYTGSCFIQFVVERDGSIGRIKILKSANKHVDKASIAAVKKIPKLIPGMQDSVNVPVRYMVPINVKFE